MSSCGHDHSHEHEHEHSHDDDALEAEYLRNDPTLSSCCERDMRDYRKAMALKAQLTAVDPTSGGVRLRQQLFRPPPAAIEPPSSALPPGHAAVDAEDSDSDFSDDEFGLDEAFAARRLELERQMRQAAKDAANGFGVVRPLGAAAFLRQLKDEREVPRVALFVGADAKRTAALQSEMEAVAKRFIGSRFFAVQVAAADEEVVRQLRLRKLPCLAAFRDGERVDATAIDDGALENPQVLWEAQLLPWLTMCSVLSTDRRQPPTSATSSKKKISGGGDSDDEDGEPSGFDCGMDNCRLRFTYEHEHVGSSKEVKDEVSSWRQPTASH